MDFVLTESGTHDGAPYARSWHFQTGGELGPHLSGRGVSLQAIRDMWDGREIELASDESLGPA